jgi:hypothetical protein
VNAKNSLASPTPIVDGDRVYVHFGAEGTAALSAAGAILWKTRLPYQSQHGNGGSPILAGKSLVFSVDGSDVQFVVASSHPSTPSARADAMALDVLKSLGNCRSAPASRATENAKMPSQPTTCAPATGSAFILRSFGWVPG